jgi:hypothetical protein
VEKIGRSQSMGSHVNCGLISEQIKPPVELVPESLLSPGLWELAVLDSAPDVLLELEDEASEAELDVSESSIARRCVASRRCLLRAAERQERQHRAADSRSDRASAQHGLSPSLMQRPLIRSVPEPQPPPHPHWHSPSVMPQPPNVLQ